MRQFPRLEKYSAGEPSRMQLRLALGMTCSTSSCLAVDPASATLAYPASGVAVLLDIIQCKQKSYIFQGTQQISCINFSPDGSLLLIGETGYMPALRVWWIQHEVELAKFQEHQYGIISASFSKKMDIVVSIGAQHDNFINVWAWPSGNKIACNRFAEDIYAMSFSDDGSYFVTSGAHHIKFWYPIVPKKEPHKYFPLRPHLTTLYGRPAILREIKHRHFVDVVCGSETSCPFVYTVTRCGLVCKLSADREVKMFKRLQNTQLSSLQVHDKKLIVGSNCGHIYFFDSLTLQLKASVSLPLDICFAEQVLRCHKKSLEAAVEEHRANIFLAYDNLHCLLTAVLTSGSLCVWDITDWDNIKKKYYSVSHSGAITDLDIMRSSEGSKNKETMVTVSHDTTVRLWNIVTCKGISCESSKTIYTEFDRNLPPVEEPAATSQENHVKTEVKKTRIITSIKVSPDLDVLVTGDSNGVISVYDRTTLENIKTVIRHSRGITALDILSHKRENNRTRLLASGGRDRLINIFNMENNFSLLNCLKVHSGTVTSIAFYSNLDYITLLSSGLDRSLVMCKSERFTLPHFRPCHCRHPTSSVIDIVVCPQEAMVGVGRINGKVSIIDAITFDQIKRFNACPNVNARLEKLQIHPKSNLMLTACTDRTVNVLSFSQGHLLATVYGHAKGISGLNFSLNMKFIVSTSRDGCIFIWSIPDNLFRPGVRSVRSSVQALEKPKTLRHTISVVQLPEMELLHRRDSFLFMNAAKGDFPRMITFAQEPTDQLLHKPVVDEETMSIDEFPLSYNTSCGVQELENPLLLPFSPTSLSSPGTPATGVSSKTSPELTVSNTERRELEHKDMCSDLIFHACET